MTRASRTNLEASQATHKAFSAVYCTSLNPANLDVVSKKGNLEVTMALRA